MSSYYSFDILQKMFFIISDKAVKVVIEKKIACRFSESSQLSRLISVKDLFLTDTNSYQHIFLLQVNTINKDKDIEQQGNVCSFTQLRHFVLYSPSKIKVRKFIPPKLSQ